MAMNDDNDVLLASQAQQGNREAFLTLYNRYLIRVHNRVKSRIPEADVDDVVQEIFIAAIRSLRTFEQRSQFSTWLYTIVNRQIADFYRKRQRTIGEDQTVNYGLSSSARNSAPGKTQKTTSKTPNSIVSGRGLSEKIKPLAWRTSNI